MCALMSERCLMNSCNLSKKQKERSDGVFCIIPSVPLMSSMLVHGNSVSCMILLDLDDDDGESDTMMTHHLSHGRTFRMRRHHRHATKTPRTQRRKSQSSLKHAKERGEKIERCLERQIRSPRHFLKWQWRFLWASPLMSVPCAM